MNILEDTILNKDVNNIIFNMIRELPLKEKIQHYSNHLELFEDEKNVNEGMELAALYGNKKLVDFFISKGADDNWNFGMGNAAEGGHLELVEFFISKGARAWNKGMEGAAWAVI